MGITRLKIGLLGGSFDPVHYAHIMLAETAYRELDLNSLQLIPAGNPWQRGPLATKKHHRLAMLRLATGKRTWLQINTVEMDRDGPTYTIDTIKQLPPAHDYYWILGSDQLNNFCTWRAWQDIAQHVQLVVAERPDNPGVLPEPLARHLQALNRTIIHLPFSPQAISATQIRSLLAQGKSADSYLDPAVATYIRQHQLYKGDGKPQLTV